MEQHPEPSSPLPEPEGPAPTTASGEPGEKQIDEAFDGWWAADQPQPEPSAEPGESGARPRRKVGRWVAAAAVVAVLAGGAAVAAGSAGSDGEGDSVAAEADASGGGQGEPGNGGAAGPRRPGTSGELTAVQGSTLTVDTGDAEVQVEVAEDTTVTETVEIELTELTVGATVTVQGELDGDQVTAERIVDSNGLATGPAGFGGTPPAGADGQAPPEDMTPPEGFSPPEGAEEMTPPEGFTPPEGAEEGGPPGGGRTGGGVAGEITAVDTDRLTLTTEAGETITVLTDDETTVSQVREIALDDLVEGDTVTVAGSADEGGTVAAETIRRGELGGFPGGPGGGPMSGGPGGPGSDDGAAQGQDPTSPSTTEA